MAILWTSRGFLLSAVLLVALLPVRFWAPAAAIPVALLLLLYNAALAISSDRQRLIATDRLERTPLVNPPDIAVAERATRKAAIYGVIVSALIALWAIIALL
jgi:hypothetical protein